MKNDKQKVAREDFAAWWVSHEDITEVLDPVHGAANGLPSYVLDELEGMQGRPLRGRLWVPPFMKGPPGSFDIGEAADFGTPFGRALARTGAIIVRREDVPKLQHFPGHVTTLELERLPSVANGALAKLGRELEEMKFEAGYGYDPEPIEGYYGHDPKPVGGRYEVFDAECRTLCSCTDIRVAQIIAALLNEADIATDEEPSKKQEGAT